MIPDFVVVPFVPFVPLVSLVSSVSVIPRERSDRGNFIKPTTQEIATSLTLMCTKKRRPESRRNRVLQKNVNCF